MALPNEHDTYENYTDQIVYFAARLAANPVTAALAQDAEALLAEIDQDYAALRDHRREEVRKRAQRDHQDDQGDGRIKKYRRHIGAVARGQHFVVTRLFPKGVEYTVAPRGRPQLERLTQLIQETDRVLASPQLAADPDAAELTAILQTGKTDLQQLLTAQQARVEAWEQQILAVSRAQDTFNFRRSDGVGRMGMVVGQLRTVLGGSLRDAYAYTQPGPSRRAPTEDTPPADDSDDDDAPGGTPGTPGGINTGTPTP